MADGDAMEDTEAMVDGEDMVEAGAVKVADGEADETEELRNQTGNYSMDLNATKK